MLQPLVLYIEDEQSDVFFMELAFGESGCAQLQTVTNGPQALEYLQGKGRYADRSRYPLPELILLDLKLPLLSGLAVLQWLRSQPQFQAVPVVVFSSSPDSEDQNRALQRGANEYLTKPTSGLEFQSVVEALAKRWLATA